eukprot:8289380-Pyramimonas_sp.AAC.1
MHTHKTLSWREGPNHVQLCKPQVSIYSCVALPTGPRTHEPYQGRAELCGWAHNANENDRSNCERLSAGEFERE